MSQKKTTNSDKLPVNAARPMALISAVMSLGMTLLIYFFFLSSAFSGYIALLILPIMLALTAVSAMVALNNVRQKIHCPHCDALFFSGVAAMFRRPVHCAACQQPPTLHGDT